MRAARFYKRGEPLRIEDVPRPEPEPGWAVVKVAAAGICHTELHFTDDGLLTPARIPITLGHEVAGVVEDAGGEARVRAGERVSVYYYGPCGACFYCEAGQTNLCNAPRALLAFATDGGFAEYVKVPASSLVPLPPSIPLEAGATLGCSATTALHALRAIGKVRMGETIVVYGVGGIGLLMVQIGRLMGARVLAASRTEAKLSRALELGAELAINVTREDLVGAVKAATGGLGADAVFELVGREESMVRSIACLRKRGRLVFVGYSEASLTVHPIPLVVGELTITASVGNTLQELRDVIELVASEKLHPLVDSVFPLERVNQALDVVRRGEMIGRVVLKP